MNMTKRRYLRDLLTEETLHLHYTVLGKSTEQIAAELGCSGSRVRAYIRDHGIPLSPAMRKKIRDNIVSSGERYRFRRGQPSVQKGHTKETHPGIAKSAAAKIGLKRPDITGPLHHNWNGGITDDAIRLRTGIAHKQWRRAVFARDNYICQTCGIVGTKLEAHHIKPFATHPESRFDVANGVTLCFWCHRGKERPKIAKHGSADHHAALSAGQKKRWARIRARGL